MTPLERASRADLASVRFVLTDMDETLTFGGRLAAQTYDSLERLQAAGVVVMPVTAAPAGWGDQMARMWPVDGVIAENGGLFLERDGHGARRTFWSPDATAERDRLQRSLGEVQRRAPFARLADDQPFRLTTLAFQDPGDDARRAGLFRALHDEGLQTTANNLWVLGWLGGFDKLTMARRILGARFDLDVAADKGAVIYVGDSTNDAPMFGYFPKSVGVSTVVRYLPQIPKPPTWVTQGPGGAGFVEVADALIAART
jgi:hydroxymethylpyrimidine pyrophosphatase-like HAD family hydrolase